MLYYMSFHPPTKAKRALITSASPPSVASVHLEGPPPPVDPQMKAWAQAMPAMMNFYSNHNNNSATTDQGRQMSAIQMQHFWRMQQIRATNSAAFMESAIGSGSITSSSTAATETDSNHSSDAEGTSDDISNLRRRASLVDGAQVLAGMRIGMGNSNTLYLGTSPGSVIASTIEDISEEKDIGSSYNRSNNNKTPSSKTKGRAGSRASGGRSPRTTRKLASSRAKSGSSKSTRVGGRAAATTDPGLSKVPRNESSPTSAAGKNSRAKETHRQAEQRRRGEQIRAVMELKTELDLHEGTPLGETLMQAAEHIRGLQQDDIRLRAEIENLVSHPMSVSYIYFRIDGLGACNTMHDCRHNNFLS